MSQTSLSVWFVCRLCRGSFGQVDAFIDHKKQKHFTQFQNTTSIVFEESEQSLPYRVITNNRDNQIVDASNKPPIEIDGSDDDLDILSNTEVVDEQDVCVFEFKSEPVTYESEINSDNENNSLGLEQHGHNPYVLLKRLTSEEIQRACVPKHRSTISKCEQEKLANNSETSNLLDVDTNIDDHNAVKKSEQIQPTGTEEDLQFECKLCSKQLESEAELKIHVGTCALDHEDRHRFCVICNKQFCDKKKLKDHRLRFHGTEEEKMSLYKFKCYKCPKQYRRKSYLQLHLDSHWKTKTPVKTSSTSKPKSLKCSHPNCGKEFQYNSELQRHITAVHLGERPFHCSVPNCNKKFAQSGQLNAHLHVHTRERPFKCSVDNCNETFRSHSHRWIHRRLAHPSL